jgi:hypothetical protein
MLLQDTQKVYLRSLIDNVGLKTNLSDRNTTKPTPQSVDQVHKKYVAFLYDPKVLTVFTTAYLWFLHGVKTGFMRNLM